MAPDHRQAGDSRPIAHAVAADPVASRGLFLAAGLAFLLFIVYGSLVPFDFHDRSFDDAWRDFQNIPWLTLGVESRADWVANLLLYIPLGFCFTAVLDGTSGRFRAASVASGVAVFLLGSVTAIGVEFTQLFFPPRTVSLNDIVAELLGTGAGIVLWWVGGGRFARLLGSVSFGGQLAMRAAVTVYVLGYLALSFFPFDFLLNTRELAEKMSSGLYDPFIVRSACGGFFSCGVRLTSEIAAAAPLGVLMGFMLRRGAPRPYARAFGAGCILGAVVEIGQFFIASGVSQGISILTRGAGLFAGMAVQRSASHARVEAARPYLRLVVAVAVLPYAGLLMALNGWFSGSWTDIAAAAANLQEVRFLPFYYHYFTTESSALQSLLRTAAGYLPVGIGCWLWRFGADRSVRGSAWAAAAIAICLATVMEAGRLFVPERHPDPTDILIAAFAAWFGYAAAAAVRRWSADSPATLRAAGAGASRQGQRVQHRAPGESRVLLQPWSVLIAIAIAPLVLLHPFAGVLALFLAAYAAFLWRWPWAALPAVLALLPLLNFSPWTGWILVDEFDLLVAVTIAVWLSRRPAQIGAELARGRATWAVVLLALSFALSAVAGLLPFQMFDQSALMGYYDSLNSVRVAKGCIWALALLPLLNDDPRYPGRWEHRMVAGIALGLAAVAAVAVWQRISIASLLDFSTDYRIAATFPETHIGGGEVEAYLAMAIPFAVAWLALRPTAIRLAAGALLFALGSYTLGVTFARAGYLAYGGVMAVLGAAFALRWFRRPERRLAGLAVACAVAVIAGAIMVPILTSSFMKSRVAVSESDGAFRLQHWNEAIDMMDRGVSTAVIGMGLGSYPRTYLLKNPAGALPATFNYLREGGNGFVRLGSGEALYLDQRVPATAGQAYTLSLDVRSADPGAGVSVSLCEKTEQHAFECKRMDVSVKAAGEKWSRETFAFDSGKVGAGSWLLRRPVVVSLTNPRAGTRVDVDNVSLLDSGGSELVANGDFSRAGAHWFFTTDNHAQWHVFNFWVHVFFEQGWLGVLAFAAAVLTAVARLAPPVWRGDLISATLLAALCGALIVGFFNSLLDGPRVATLFLLLLFASLTRTVPAADQRR